MSFLFVVLVTAAGLLEGLDGQCTQGSDTGEVQFKCSGFSSESSSPRFQMVTSNPQLNKKFFELRIELKTQMTTPTNCTPERVVDALFGYRTNYVSMHRHARVTGQGKVSQKVCRSSREKTFVRKQGICLWAFLPWT